MKTALVLSGGGAKGAYQAGVLTKLIEKGITFDCVAGVSVGSLNGAMIAQNRIDDMIHVWQTIEEKDIFTKYSYLKIAWRNIVQDKKSLYNASPLLNIIQQHVSLEKTTIPFYIGLTSLTDGKYYSLNQTDFASNTDLQSAVFASSLMPILWEPVSVKTKDQTILQAVDGGLRNVTPLKDIIKELPDVIYIVSCNSTSDLPKKTCTNIIQVAMRTFTEIMLSEIIDNDVRGLIKKNLEIKQISDHGLVLTNPFTGQPYKYFEIHFIKPDTRIGSPLDFSRSTLDNHFDLGYNAI